jgi:3-hydroxymyristoyl/3-hydroxydecanoyl-(acyl carrier protein) dehydratase
LNPPRSLPHEYPFRFVETVLRERNADFSEGTVLARVTSNGWASAGGGWASPLLLVEAIAQAALLLEGGDTELARRGLLAGIDGFEATRSPQAGETLAIDVRLAARFGSIVKFDGLVRSDGDTIARGSVLVRRGEPPEIE